MYYITAPQDGFITKAIQSGIGETINAVADLFWTFLDPLIFSLKARNP